MTYLGGMDRTFEVNPDNLCFDFLMSPAAKCIEQRYIEGLYYVKPGMTLKDGLRNVVREVGAFHLGKTAVESRFVDVYVVQTLPKSCLSLVIAELGNKE